MNIEQAMTSWGLKINPDSIRKDNLTNWAGALTSSILAIRLEVRNDPLNASAKRDLRRWTIAQPALLEIQYQLTKLGVTTFKVSEDGWKFYVPTTNQRGGKILLKKVNRLFRRFKFRASADGSGAFFVPAIDGKFGLSLEVRATRESNIGLIRIVDTPRRIRNG